MLQIVEINPKDTPQASVIWLHGLGADGYDFLDIIPQLNLSSELQIHFVFPHAPIRTITYANDAQMRAWFNLVEIGYDVKEDETHIRRSEELIGELIRIELAKGIPGHRIVIAGFSQGGAMALQCGLRYPEKLAGILVLSAWLPLKHTVLGEKEQANQQTSIFMAHGDADDLVSVDWARNSSGYLRDLGYDVAFATYPMGHSVCLEEIKAIGVWLNNLLR